MRTKAFGDEPAGSLLESGEVARASLDTLISGGTGHIVDIRRVDPLGSHQAAAESSAASAASDGPVLPSN
jgi:2-C-methyl-D-erythritol 4-phosphate cytidylyltransferase